MAEASAHHKEMKDFMGAEVFVAGIKNGKLKCIDNTAHCVNNSPCQKPSKACPWQCVDDSGKGQDANPSHGNIEKGRKPLGTGDPARFDENTRSGDAPN